MKFYDFIEKAPPIGRLAIVEGTEELFAERAIVKIEERLLDPATRDLNCDRFIGPELDGPEPVAAACAAMPFLGSTRVIIVRRTQAMRAPARRALWAVAQAVPEGNTLVLEDLQPPNKRTKPETFGQMAGRDALRIDATATDDARRRFVRETLANRGLTAEPAAIEAIVASELPLIAVVTDLDKLALAGSRITLEAVLRESIAGKNVKAYQAAAALVEGNAARALELVEELSSSLGAREAAVPLFSAIAGEYLLVWELARPGGALPSRSVWRERALRPVARRLGEHRARRGYEQAVRSFEAFVTGRGEDLRGVVALLAADAAEGRERRGVRTTGAR